MIELRDVSHRFGRRPVLDSVSLSAESRSVVGLVGPNGAGKSTLLRLLATLLKPMQGELRVGGVDVRAKPAEVRRLVGFLPERDNPYADLTVWEYLDLFAEIAGIPRGARQGPIERALEQAGLQDRTDQLTGQLSKGLKQRLSLQSVLLHQPRVLLLDEPTDGLDPQSRDFVCRQVRAIADSGCAVIISSHVLEELERVADRTIALIQGRATELRATSAPTWTLRLRGDLAIARLVAMGVASVAEASLDGDRLTAQLQGGASDPGELTSALVQGGIAVIGISEHRSSLRELYDQAVAEARA